MNYSYLAGFLVCLILFISGAYALITDSNIGSGVDGNLYFTTGTKLYGNLTTPTDYNVSGNVLFLKTDRFYDFNEFFLGTGTTLKTTDTNGIIMIIKSTGRITINGRIDLNGTLTAGTRNFNIIVDGNTITSKSNQKGSNGANGNTSGYPQAGGSGGTTTTPWGGGGGGGGGQCDPCVGGNGGNGGYPGGSGGNSSGSNGGTSAGGGGGSSAAQGGTGGNAYGNNGNNGSSLGGGGGGAGGQPYSPGISLLLKSKYKTLTGTIILKGTNGGSGGTGGTTPDSDAGHGGQGGGAGGADSGDLYIITTGNPTQSTNIALTDLNKGIKGSGGSGGIDGNNGILVEQESTSYLTIDNNSTQQKTPPLLILRDRTTKSDDLTYTREWKVNTTTVSTAQDYNMTAIQLTDYNVCLFIYASDGDYNASNCKTISTGDWQAPTVSVTATQRTNRTDANIVFICTDNNSGCNKLFYQVDSNGWQIASITTGNFQTIYGGGSGDHNIYYLASDMNDNNSTQQTYSYTITADTNPPTILFTTSFGTGFVNDYNITLNLTCYDDRLDLITYDINLLTDTNNTNLYHTTDTNGTTKTTNYVPPTSQQTQFKARCTDASGNYIEADSNIIYALTFNLINENTGAVITCTDLNNMVTRAYASTYDNNYYFDFNASCTSTKKFIGSDNVIRFEFIYKDDASTRIQREIDFGLIADTDANVPVCLAPYTPPTTLSFAQQIFVAATEKDVILYNSQAKCYNLVSSTKFAYKNALSTTAYTISKVYYFYTYIDGVKTLLAYIDGDLASEINVDVLQFNQTSTDIVFEYDTIAIAPLLDAEGLPDGNVLQIKYYNEANDNTQIVLKIYKDGNLLWSYTENAEPNDVVINWNFSDYNISVSDQLKLIVTKTNAEGTEDLTVYFNTRGESQIGVINPVMAVIFVVLLVMFGLTFVGYRYAFGWFGIIVCIMGIGILAYAPWVWYIKLMIAVVAIILAYIFLIYKNENAGVSQ